MVAVDPQYFRPTEVQELLGDAGKARKKLGWKPRIPFEQLVAEMVEADMKEAQKDSLCQLEGFQTFNHFDT
jgi:GDPmannose 4,6-dehydratase